MNYLLIYNNNNQFIVHILIHYFYCYNYFINITVLAGYYINNRTHFYPTTNAALTGTTQPQK